MSDSFGLGPGPLSRPDPVEPQRSGGARVLLWILVIVLIVAVALTGGAFAAGLIGGDDDPAAAPASAPTTGAASTRPGTGGTAASTGGPEQVSGGSMTVALPETLGGMTRAKGDKPSSAGNVFPVTTRVEGTFGGGRNIMYVLALAGSEMSREQRTALFSTDIGNRFKTGTLESVEPGPLGGSAHCGEGTWNGQDAAVCLWDDTFSNGVLVDSPGNADALAGKLPALRAEVERPAA